MSTTAVFTGSSKFSTDFQNVITRATAIASLPISQLTADKASLTDQATALTGIDGTFKTLQTAVQGIADALTGSSFETIFSDSASDPSKVSVGLSEGAAEGNYTIDVLDPGVYATSMSGAWIAGSGARTYQLSLGGVNYALSPVDNTAAAVVSAINSQYGDKVHATLANVGAVDTPDLRISLQAVELGDLKPSILVGPASSANLQSQQTAGSSTLASSLTAQTWDENPALTYQLSIGGAAYEISSTAKTAQGIADAINSQQGDKVTAGIVNLGTSERPDYRINLTATGPGDAQPDLLAVDGGAAPASLQTQTAAGSSVKASSRTASAWVAPAGPALAYQLSLGGQNYHLEAADNNIESVVSAINTQYPGKVTAAKVDLGTGGTHDYRISLTAVNPGDLKPDISAAAADVQKQQAIGSLADYIVSNSGLHVSSKTRTVKIAEGITVTLLAKDNGTPVNFTVMRPTSAVSDALSAFVTAYNAAVDEVDKQHGSAAGPLAGQSMLSALSHTLSGMATYSSSTGGLAGLASLGVELDKTGHLSFNPFSLAASDIMNSAGVTAFLGSASSGFLKLAMDSLNGVENSVTGLLTTAAASVQNQITSITNTIADQQARVDLMTERMQTQMAAADALISSMEQQYSYLAGMFDAMQTATKSYA